jgi:hypothetical protein
MTPRPVSEDALRKAHAELLALRASGADPGLPVETVQALAAGTYQGADRLDLLDRALAHPVSARELQLFADLAALTPVNASRRRAGLWALAASVLLAVGVASIWGVRGWWAKEEVRGGNASFELVEPAQDQLLERGARFLWRSAAGGTAYRLELVDAEGSVAFSLATRDTAGALPDSVRLAPGRYQARVLATLRDGTEQRTSATRVTVP